MTVKEFIEELKEYPQDYEVVIFNFDDDYGRFLRDCDIYVNINDKEIWLNG